MRVITDECACAMDTLDEILEKYVARDNDDLRDKLLGAAFVVVDRSRTLYEGAAGRVDIFPTSTAFSPSSLTWVASLSKIVTIPAVLQLVERGLVRLDADVRQIVPELGALQILRGFDPVDGAPVLEDHDGPVTLRHLLTHTVGLAYDLADPDLVRWSAAVGRTVTNLSFTLEGWTTPFKFSPGNGWCYGSAIDWAGQVLERVTGQTLGAYLEEHVLGPLGMADTTFHSTEAGSQVRKVACTFRDRKTGNLKVGPLPVPENPPVESAGAGLWTTGRDHVKMLRALLEISAGGTEGGEGILKKETVDEMFRPQLDETQHAWLKRALDRKRTGMAPEFPPGTRAQHGIGGLLNMEDLPGKRRAGSMQWMGMANSHWWIDRETGIAASLIVNVEPLPDSAVIQLYDELERVVYGKLLPGL